MRSRSRPGRRASDHCNERMTRGERDPDRDRDRAAHQRAPALRQHDVGQPQEDRRGVDRQARQRAFRDEGRVMVEREEDVGRPRRNRQGRDQRADHRPRALGDDRGRHHEGRGDRHAQGEDEEEGDVGRHIQPSSRPSEARAGTHNHRPSCGAKAVERRFLEPIEHGVWVPAFAGTTREPHTRFIDTETFGPFLMVW